MNMKKKPLYTLLSLLIVLALAVPVWSTVVRADNPTEISDWNGLDAIRNDLSGSYILVNDLDSATVGYDDLAGPDANDGNGWQPIGVLGDSFTGSFDGQGYEIRDLLIDRDDEEGVGLFGAVHEGGVIQNVGVVSVNVTGFEGVGGLVGDNWGGTVINSYATGSVVGDYYVGGLVGWSEGSVADSYFGGSVSGEEWCGGLMGGNGGIVSSSYSVGSVTGDVGIGGLVGDNFYGTVTQSYSAATVTGNHQVGGLVADNLGGTVTNSYSTATVTGVLHVGGLLGVNAATGAADGGLALSDEDTLDGSYCTSREIRVMRVAGQAETNQAEGTVDNCYATGTVTGDSDVGGLVGLNWDGTVTNSFWDMDTSGQATSAGGTGKTTAEMQDFATFTDTDTEGLDDPWDMTDVPFGTPDPAFIWNIVDGQTYPLLSWEPVGQIRDWHDLDAVRGNLSGQYTLMNDLDSTTLGYDELAGGDADDEHGWLPIGTSANPFSGTFHGQGYKIGDLVLNRPEEDYVGLFAVVALEGTVEDVGLVNADVTGRIVVGALAGMSYGTVSNCYSGGAVIGESTLIGGLVGRNHGSVRTSYAIVSVFGTSSIGGLLGRNDGDVEDSFSTGSVTGDTDNVGGLVGSNAEMGTVSRSYATGNVAGRSRVGGLVGYNPGAVSSSYATGNVAGDGDAGGLVGWNNEGSVSDSYSTGAASRSSGTSMNLGGFVGRNLRGSIVNCYSTGSVHYEDADDPSDKGFAGTVGTGGDYEMSGNFWDTETSGQTSTAGEATGKTTVQMQDIATFSDAGWHITTVPSGETDDGYIWNIIHERTYPFLSWQTPVDAELQYHALTALTPGRAADGCGGSGASIVEVQDDEGDPIAVDVGSYQATLSYDGTLLNVLEVRHDPLFPGDETIDDAAGVTSFNGTATGGVPYPCDLAFLSLRLTGTAEQPVTATLTFSDIRDGGGNPIGQILPSSENTFLRGDARADGEVNISDALWIAQYLAGLREIGYGLDKVHPVNAASVKWDGDCDEINISDALFIAQYLAGLRGPDYGWLAP